MVCQESKKLSSNEKEVLEYLKHFNDFVSPTSIGCALRSSRHNSAWASPICKRLVNKGLLERSEKGWYKISAIQRGLLAVQRGLVEANVLNKTNKQK